MKTTVYLNSHLKSGLTISKNLNVWTPSEYATQHSQAQKQPKELIHPFAHCWFVLLFVCLLVFIIYFYKIYLFLFFSQWKAFSCYGVRAWLLTVTIFVKKYHVYEKLYMDKAACSQKEKDFPSITRLCSPVHSTTELVMTTGKGVIRDSREGDKKVHPGLGSKQTHHIMECGSSGLILDGKVFGMRRKTRHLLLQFDFTYFMHPLRN